MLRCRCSRQKSAGQGECRHKLRDLPGGKPVPGVSSCVAFCLHLHHSVSGYVPHDKNHIQIKPMLKREPLYNLSFFIVDDDQLLKEILLLQENGCSPVRSADVLNNLIISLKQILFSLTMSLILLECRDVQYLTCLAGSFCGTFW